MEGEPSPERIQELERLKALDEEAGGRLESNELERLAALLDAQARGELTQEESLERTALMAKLAAAESPEQESEES